MNFWPKLFFFLSLIVFLIGFTLRLSEKPPPSLSFSSLNNREPEPQNSTYEIMGFLPFWMLKNQPYLKYNRLTTLIYFGLQADASGNIKKYLEEGSSEPGWRNWEQNSNLEEAFAKAKANKTRTGVALIMHTNNEIEQLLGCPSCQKELISTTLQLMNERELDDLNLDFEYRGLASQTLRDQFTAFATEITQTIHRDFPHRRVSVSAHANSARKNRLQDIKALSPVVDQIFIMAYDFHQLTSTQTGPTAPLGGAPNKFRYDLTLMLRDYKLKAPPDKLLLGVPYYGHLWLTEDDSLGSQRLPGNERLGYSEIAYYEFCITHPENTTSQRRWDEDSQTPYFVFFDEPTQTYRQCHYDDVRSLRAKYELAKKENLAGIGIWALGYDGNRRELWDLLEEEFY